MKRCTFNDLQFLNQEVAINIFNNNDKQHKHYINVNNDKINLQKNPKKIHI